MRRPQSFALEITFGVTLLLATCVFGCANPTEETAATQASYSRVMASSKLRVAYISYPPSFVKDPNTGEFSGIFHEVLTEMGRRIGVQIDYIEETTWGTLIEAVTSGRVDIVCTGLWPNSSRGRLADFSEPVYFSPIAPYTRANETTFDGNLDLLNSPSFRIATIDGEMSSIIASTDFPRAGTSTLPQTTDIAQLLLEIASGKADVAFVEPAVAHRFSIRNPNVVKAVADIPPVRVFPNVLMLAKGELNLLSMLNTAISELVS